MPLVSADKFTRAMTPIGRTALMERGLETESLIAQRQQIESRSVLGAAFRQENLVGSLIERFGADVAQPVAGYNPFRDDKEFVNSPQYSSYLDNFSESESPEETRQIARRIDRELLDREVMAASPIAGTVAAFAAGILSPENLIPGFAAVKSAKLGNLVIGTALRTAAAGAISQTAAEVGLQATQETRTFEESAFNVGGATLLSGFFGAGVAALTGPKHIAAGQLMERIAKTPEALEQMDRELNRYFMAGASNDFTAQKNIRESLLKQYPELNELYFKSGIVKKLTEPLFKTSISGRLATSENAFTRDLADRMLNNRFVKNEALDGTAQRLSIEARGDLIHRHLYGKPTFDSTNLYKEAKKSGQLSLKEPEFFDEVGRAQRNNDTALDTSLKGAPLTPHEQQLISRAAKMWRESADQMLGEMRRLGMVSENDLDLLGTDRSWFHRQYDLDALARDPDGFVDAAAQDLLSQGHVSSIEQGRKVAHEFVNKQLNENDLSGTIPGTSAASALKQRELLVRSSAVEGYLIHDPRRVNNYVYRQLARHIEMTREFLPPPPERMVELRGEIARTTKEILKGGGRSATKAKVNELIEAINNAKASAALEGSELAERLEDLMVERDALLRKIEKPGGEPVQPFRDRLKVIRQEMKDIRAQAQEVDAELGAYTEELTGRKNTLEELNTKMQALEREAADLDRKRYLDALNMKAEKAQIKTEWEKRIGAESDPKKKNKLRKKMASDLEAIEVARQRLLGIRGIPKNPSSFGYRASRFLRNINTARFGGSFAITSFADASTGVFTQGLKPWSKSIASIALDSRAALKSVPDAVRLDGYLEQAHLGMRTHELAGLQNGEFSLRSSRPEQIAALGANLSLRASLLQPWTRGMKLLASVGITDNILSRALRVADGTASKADITELARAGIDREMAQRFASERANFYDLKGGSKATDISTWKDKEAARHFETVVLRDTEFSVVTPGLGDMPAMVDTALGGMLLQFRSFSWAATTRVLLPGLQQLDAKFLSGVLASTAFGAMSYAAAEIAAGRALSDDPGTILANSIDRAGWTGIVNELDRMLEIGTSGRLGIAASLTDERTARLRHVGFFGAIGGVSAGTLDDVFKISQSVFKDGDMTQGDINRIRRYVWFQNHFALRRLFDHAAAEIGRAAGASDKSGFRSQIQNRDLIEIGD